MEDSKAGYDTKPRNDIGYPVTIKQLPKTTAVHFNGGTAPKVHKGKHGKRKRTV